MNGRPRGRPFALAVAIATLFVGTLPVPLAAQGAALPIGVTEEMVQSGERLFKAEGNCWACHGEDATGSRGVGADLTDEQVRAVAAYVWSQRRRS